MADPILIGVEQNKFIKDADTKAISLFLPNGFLNNNYLSFHEEGNTNYIVPVDKKFVILDISVVGSGAGTGQLQWHMGYSTTPDSFTGYTFVLHVNGLQTQPYHIYPYIEIPAGNYITAFGESNSYALIITGVELNA